LIRLAILLFGIVTIFLALNSVYQFDLTAIWDRLVTGFTISVQSPDDDAVARHQQLVALLRGWLDHPFLGVGHGASVYGSIRRETAPWAYELGYVALLFQTGIVGVAAYAAGVLWVFFCAVKIIKGGGELGQMMIPMLVGFCSALIAHATNPYLDRFDGMWMFFLPIAVISHLLSVPRTGAAQSMLSRRIAEIG
jgi:O-antigen ligase